MSTWKNLFKHPIAYLLKVDGFYLRLMGGGKIVLRGTGQIASLWDNLTKN